LCNGRGADEASGVVELGADLHADGAGDAIGERVALLLNLGELLGAGAEVVGAVDGDPGFDLLEVFEEDGTVDAEVADYRELAEGREGDGLIFVGACELVYKRRAGHCGFTVDEHGARAADLFEAVGVVGDGCGGLAGDVDGVECDLAEKRGDVHARTVGDLELFGDGRCVGGCLALDLDVYHLRVHAGSSIVISYSLSKEI